MTKDDLKAMIAEHVKAAMGADFVERQKAAIQEAVAEAVKAGSSFATAFGQAAHGVTAPALEKGLMFGRIVRALAAGKGDAEKGLAFVKANWKDAAIIGQMEKALAAGIGPAGGFIVPVEYSTEIIEYLRAQAIVRRMKPTVMPMPTGTITIPKLAGGAAAGYVGENQNISNTQQTFGSLTLTYKKLAALTPVSNDLIRFATPSADTIVRDDLVAAMAVREDLAFLRGDGTANTPRGIRNWIPSGNILTMTGSVTLATVTYDLGRLILALKNNNIPMIRPGWMFAPRVEMYLMTLQTSTGNYAFRDEMLQGKLWGLPYATSTQIPTNLGGGTESEVYMVDFRDVVLGESEQIILDVSQEAAYYDGSQVIAAFSQDQTVIRAMSMHDLGMRHDASAAVLTGVTWGA